MITTTLASALTGRRRLTGAIKRLPKTRLAVLAAAGVSVSCATGLPPSPPLPLPSPTSLDCCWQSEESVNLQHSDRSITAHAIVVRKPENLRLVLMTPLGLPLLDVEHDQQNITIHQNDIPLAEQLIRHILFSIYFSHLPPGYWLQNLTAECGFSSSPSSRTMHCFGAPLISWQQLDQGNHPAYRVEFRDETRIDIQTLSRTRL